MTTKCQSCKEAITDAKCPYCQHLNKVLLNTEEENDKKRLKRIKFIYMIAAFISFLIGIHFLWGIINPQEYWLTISTFWIEIVFYFTCSIFFLYKFLTK